MVKEGTEIMEETILLIIFAVGLGNYLDEQKPLDLLYELDNGQIVETTVYKNNDYFCPVYCESSHKHIGHFSNFDCGMSVSCYHFSHPEYIAGLATDESEKEILANSYYDNNIFIALFKKISESK